MPDYWTFDGTIVDALTSPIFDRRLGAEQTVGLLFHPSDRASSYEARYQAVLDYARYAGTATISRTAGGGVYYDTDLDPAAPVSSLVVPIEPQPADTGGPFEGIWALVTGYSDENRLSNRFALGVDVAYLGDRSEYADRSAVETALTQSVI
jgi:hypothetical protein